MERGARIERGLLGIYKSLGSLNVALSSGRFPVFISFYFTLKLNSVHGAQLIYSCVGKRKGEANYVALEHDRKTSFGQQQTLQSNC